MEFQRRGRAARVIVVILLAVMVSSIVRGTLAQDNKAPNAQANTELSVRDDNEPSARANNKSVGRSNNESTGRRTSESTAKVKQPTPFLFREQNKAGIFVDLGKPSVWSLAQAHYLLAQMRESSKNIKTKDLNTLDPTIANGSRVEILRQIFGTNAQFDQTVGRGNQLALEKYDREAARQQTAIARLDQELTDRGDLVKQQSRLAQKAAVNEARLKILSAKEKGDLTNDEKNELATLPDLISQQKGEKERVDARITGLDSDIAVTKATAENAPGAPTVSRLFSQPSQPDFSPIGLSGSLADKLLDSAKTGPSMDAHNQLENTIQMQYEIIAKQLTLLRDEVGPNQRLIFLELPSSIYTTPKESKEYLVETEWKVDRYLTCKPHCQSDHLAGKQRGAGFQPLPPVAEGWEAKHKTSQTDSEHNPPPLTLTLIRGTLQAENENEPNKIKQKNEKNEKNEEQLKEQLKAVYNTYGERGISFLKDSYLDLKGAIVAQASDRDPENLGAYQRRVAEAEERIRGIQPKSDRIALTPAEISAIFPYLESPELLFLEWKDVPVNTSSSEFRTVDIIPRQSALNVNDVYSKSVGLNLQGAFQWISGIGAKVGYQRQKDLYEQFLQQEVYASGYGKGSDVFGWTFAPLPGTDRIAPGIRTTYAIMVIPSDALFIQLKGQAYVHKRKHSPTDEPGNGDDKTFILAVPAEETERFQVTGLTYTPVASGTKSTVILTGENFSPQTNILVNGARLARVTSIGESDGPTAEASKNAGIFEYLNPNRIVMSFTIPNFVGTPIITVVTPEKTSPINFFNNMSINFGTPNESLYETSKKFPMFLDALTLEAVQADPIVKDNELIVHLLGKGFLGKAEITINGVIIPERDLQHLSTGEYRITLNKVLVDRINQSATTNDSFGKPSWKVHYRHHTKQNFAEAETAFSLQTVPNDYAVKSYNRNAKGQATATLFVNVDFTPNTVLSRFITSGSVASVNSGYEVVLTFNSKDPSFPFEVTDGNLGHKRTFVFNVPDLPTISKVSNIETGKEEGPSDAHLVKIEGDFLQHVVQVRFNLTDAEIMDVSPNLILVRTPRMEGTARVLLKTDLVINDRSLTNIEDLKTPAKGKYVFKSTAAKVAPAAKVATAAKPPAVRKSYSMK